MSEVSWIGGRVKGKCRERTGGDTETSLRTMELGFVLLLGPELSKTCVNPQVIRALRTSFLLLRRLWVGSWIAPGWELAPRET